ncbi:uncharacterized protein igsf9a [Engraulis encrasicolus]|uniref:uncharacterized protein igsf9a n=1 Tax=Engraulis encrasicolus TaxID=184585 RepID=UPI002FD20132
MGLHRTPPSLLATALLTLWPLYLVRAAAAAEPSVRAKLGSVAVLRCSLSPEEVEEVEVGTAASPRGGPGGRGGHVVEWVRQGLDIPILIQFGAYAPRLHPDYEGRVSLMGDGALRIGALRLEDQGLYECRILPLEKTEGETPRNGSWTLLTVYAPPIFTETSPPVVEALLGRPVTLRCLVWGNPTPQLSWTKNGAPLQQNKMEVSNGSVSFRSVSSEAAGEYRCHAFNSEGNVSHATQLWVKGPPIIRVPPKDLVLNISQKAQLQCWAEADPPNMTYVWQRGGENVYHIQSLKSRVKVLVDGTLLVSRVTPEDSGNYTCTPTNGLLTPPSASAQLTIRHPAQVLQMPRETYLPTGMAGVIPCPVRAEPPLLRVDWTKDGKPLDLDTQYPGWTLTPQGSVTMATANEDAAGVYTCTPYNSYGTMGQSQATRVILQDPPSFRVQPKKEYRQEVGRALEVPCQARGEPAPPVTWSKVGRAPSSPFSVAENGSLLLQPLSKDHQGAWSCSSSNRVATVNITTTLLILGTSPHAVSLLSVWAGLTHANVSWEPGFDGGYTQKFTIWLKRASSEAEPEKQEWASVPVPPSAGSSFQVTGLQPATDYQFSVLPQNKMGTGPFSDIASARTLDPQPVVLELAPPTFLSANVTAGGVMMRWEPPRDQSPPVETFVLQTRVQGGQWSNLAEDISANLTHMLVQGLRRDSVYELRLLSQRGEERSHPSDTMTVSTAGLEVAVAPVSRGGTGTGADQLMLIPEPLLAGVMGGLALLCVALLLAISLACVFHRRSTRRKRRREDPALLTSPSATASAAGGSPDSVLKHKLLPPPSSSSPHSPSSSSTSSSSSSTTDSASSPSNRSTYERSSQSNYPHSQQRGHHHQQPRPRNLPLPESSLSRGRGGSRGGGGGGGGGSGRGSGGEMQELLTLSPLELISRGPDGRFSLKPLTQLPGSSSSCCSSSLSRSTPVRRSLQSDFSQLQQSHSRSFAGGGGDGDGSSGICGGIQKSYSLRSHREDRRDHRRQQNRDDMDAPFVLSVDLPPSSSHSAAARVMAKHLSLQGHYFPQDHLAHTHSVAELPERSSLLSECTTNSSSGGTSVDVCSHDPQAYLEEGERPGHHLGGSAGYASLKRVGGGGGAGGGGSPDDADDGDGDGGPSSASLLVLQMEHERERGNLSRCLTLAREREALERELRKYATDRHSVAVPMDRDGDREGSQYWHQQQQQHQDHHHHLQQQHPHQHHQEQQVQHHHPHHHQQQHQHQHPHHQHQLQTQLQQQQQWGVEDDLEAQEEPELVWKTRHGHGGGGAATSLSHHHHHPHPHHQTSRGCYSPGPGVASGRSSTRPSSCVLWEAAPMASPTHLVQVHTPPPASAPAPHPLPSTASPPQDAADRHWVRSDSQRSSKRSPLVAGAGTAGVAGPALYPERESPRREHLEALRRGCVSPDRLSVVAASAAPGSSHHRHTYQDGADDTSTVTALEHSGTQRRSRKKKGARDEEEEEERERERQGEERSGGGPAARSHPNAVDCTFVEMSVDGPEIEERRRPADSTPGRGAHTLGRRRDGDQSRSRERERQQHAHHHPDTQTLHRTPRRGGGGTTHGGGTVSPHRPIGSSGSKSQSSRTLSHSRDAQQRPDLRKTGSLGPQGWAGAGAGAGAGPKGTNSLDWRSRKDGEFLTPEAWIHSLSMNEISGSPSSSLSSPPAQHEHEYENVRRGGGGGGGSGGNGGGDPSHHNNNSREMSPRPPHSRGGGPVSVHHSPVSSQNTLGRKSPADALHRATTPNPQPTGGRTPNQQQRHHHQSTTLPRDFTGRQGLPSHTPNPQPTEGRIPFQRHHQSTTLPRDFTGHQGLPSHTTPTPTTTSPLDRGHPTTPNRHPVPDQAISPPHYVSPDRAKSPPPPPPPAAATRGPSQPPNTSSSTLGRPQQRRHLAERSLSPPAQARALSLPDRGRQGNSSALLLRPPSSLGEPYAAWQPDTWHSSSGRVVEEEQGRRRPGEEVLMVGVVRRKEEEEEERGDEHHHEEVDAEIRAYRYNNNNAAGVAESEGSYRSYASQSSSGRGSLDPPSSLSPPLTSSPETTEDSEQEDKAPQDRRRNSSVDESYEWDSSQYVSMRPVYLKPAQGQQRSLGKEEEEEEEADWRRHSYRTNGDPNKAAGGGGGGGGEEDGGGMFPSIKLLKPGGSLLSPSAAAGLPPHHHRHPHETEEAVLF